MAKSAALAAAAALGTGSSSSPNSCPRDPAAGTAAADAALGGAVLELLSSDTSKPACKAEVAPLAEWLQGNKTYMGFNFTGIAGPNTNHEGSAGVQWQVLGSLEGSNLSSWPYCGAAHGGPGPQPGLTLKGTALSEWSCLLFLKPKSYV